jgi:hypothetical protein
MAENNATLEDGKKRKKIRASIISKAIMLLSVLACMFSYEKDRDMQYGTTITTEVMVTSPCRLVR